MSGFAHAMPFGAEVRADGSVRFRLWAPEARAISLFLADSDRTVPMDDCGSGWYELEATDARADARYCFVLDDGTKVPDPASRAQENDPDGCSIVIDPRRYEWQQPDWRGRPWQEVTVYEIHVGAFTPEGTFAAAMDKLDYIRELGITAIELMPLADFAGARNWGYDGVLPFAPDVRYGKPEDLKTLIDAAHARGISVFLDAVYNHFGPEGNYIGRYAPQFFTDRARTPWGQAINFALRPVRDYFIHNALYWLEEYRFDGLRLDAVHAIHDDGRPFILEELARTVRCAICDRSIHLILEDDHNRASLLARDEVGNPIFYNAQWNDDFHHAAHVLLTGERTGYYSDYTESGAALARALSEGFIYQGEPSAFRGGASRGEPSATLPPDAFIGFLQNHDQIGNRALGDRLTSLAKPEALRALHILQLLCPQIPLLFMGEEWGSKQPFPFFCDFRGELGAAVREGRKREFPQFAADAVPDSTTEETFLAAKLDWPDRPTADLDLTRRLLVCRAEHVIPLLKSGFECAQAAISADGLLRATWRFRRGSLHLHANLTDARCQATDAHATQSIFSTHDRELDTIPPWFVMFSLGPDSVLRP